jgi:hypothetical protein
MSGTINRDRLDIVIPTRNRFGKLIEVLKTIPQYSFMELSLGFDGDRTSFEKFSKMWGYWKGKSAFTYFFADQTGSVNVRNYMTSKCPGSVLWATDDILFRKGSIESAWESLWREFPDGDGVVGFRQENARPAGNFCWTGVAIMGPKFLKRYPDKMISYPGYFHFGTREIETLAKKLNKLYKDKNANIYHNHPDFYPKQMDTTHVEARVHQDQDVKLKKERVKQGLIWGFGNESHSAYSTNFPRYRETVKSKPDKGLGPK